jgi:response regulator RpfG family c-di-GMP phosphodiesterase
LDTHYECTLKTRNPCGIIYKNGTLMNAFPKHTAIGKIILIDKDPNIRTMMEMILGDHFQVVTAGSAMAGLDLVESEAPFDIVIASFSLPGMNGVEFLRRVGEKHPETVRIILTGGFADMSDLNLAVSEGHISRVISKPIHMDILMEQLKQDMAVKKITGNNLVPTTDIL